MQSLAFATIAEQSEDALQGRVTSAAIQLSSLGEPIGPVLAGVLLSDFRPAPVVLGYAAVLLALTLAALLSPALRSAA